MMSQCQTVNEHRVSCSITLTIPIVINGFAFKMGTDLDWPKLLREVNVTVELNIRSQFMSHNQPGAVVQQLKADTPTTQPWEIMWRAMGYLMNAPRILSETQPPSPVEPLQLGRSL